MPVAYPGLGDLKPNAALGIYNPHSSLSQCQTHEAKSTSCPSGAIGSGLFIHYTPAGTYTEHGT